MSNRDPIWDALKADRKAKFDADRERFLEEAHAENDGGWTIHTDYHWSRIVAGHRLDYWPSRKKFQYCGKVRRGDVIRFIESKEAKQAGIT
jgi:hypothetical protein